MPFHLQVFLIPTTESQPTLRLSCTYIERCYNYADSGDGGHGLDGFSLAIFGILAVAIQSESPLRGTFTKQQ